MRQGTKKVMQDDRTVTEVEEPVRGKTLVRTKRISILARNYAEVELECDKLEGKFEIKPEPFLQQREPNLWMDSFILYNVPEDSNEVNVNEEIPNQTTSKDIEDKSSSRKIEEKEGSKICIPYCVFNLSYENHSYIPKGRVIAFAEKENDEENEIFKIVQGAFSSLFMSGSSCSR